MKGVAPKSWFRLYAEFANDPKIQLLAFEDQRHFVVLLCLKCNGTLDSGAPQAAFRDRMIAKALGLSIEAASEVRRRLVEIGLVTEDWQPTRWADRQYEADASADRTRKWRERKVLDGCDVTVTSQQRHGDGDVTSQDRHGDVTVTDKSRDRAEQSREDARQRARATPSLDTSAWDRFLEHRGKLRKPVRDESLEAMAKQLATYGTMQMAVVEQSIARGWEGLFDLKNVSHETSRTVVEAAARAWDLLTANKDTNTTAIRGDPVAVAALEAIGGYSRVRMRKTAEVPKLRAEFIKAYGDASKSTEVAA